MTPNDFVKANLESGAIQAYAEGRPIDCKTTGDWYPWVPFTPTSAPLFGSWLYRPSVSPVQRAPYDPDAAMLARAMATDDKAMGAVDCEGRES